jgi:hypothetical protein
MPYPNEVSRLSKTTANGTAYVEVTLSLDGDTCLVCIPSEDATALLLCAHGHSGDQTTINNVRMVETRDRMIDQGWIVASSYAQGNSWGNQAGQDAYVLLSEWVHTQFPVTDTVFHGQSMGGLIVALLYANDVIPDVRGMVTIDGAVNLSVAHANASYRSAIRTAYGIASDGSDYAAKTVGHDPCVIAATLYDGKRMLLEASTGDTAIPKAQHADVFVTHIDGHPAQLSRLTGTGPHVDVSNYFPADVEAFVLSTLEPLPAGDVFWARKSVFVDGELARVLSRVGVCWQPVEILDIV